MQERLKTIRQLFDSLGVKLFAGIFGATVVVFAAFSYVGIHQASQVWIRSVERQAGQTCAVIERALRNGMLLNRKEDVYAMLRDIAREPGINTIRIYNRRGDTVFSTRPSEIGSRINRRAQACAICHQQRRPIRTAPEASRSRTYRDASGSFLLSRIHPIENDPSCSSASCHAHPPKQSILGVLDLKLSVDIIDQSEARAKHALFYITLLMATFAGAAVGLFIWKFVREPVRQLVEGTRRVAAGRLDRTIQIKGRGEMKDLADAFNRMTEDLAEAGERQRQWEDQLEDAVKRKTEELGRAQGQIVHMERMASLGKLAATVAHELNNPLAGILVYSKLVLRAINGAPLSDEAAAEARHHLEVIGRESTRCGEIVRNLLVFARQSKTAFAEHRFNQIIERSLMTVQHLLKEASVEVRVVPLDDDHVVGDANQLQQALVALLINAAEAMPTGGELVIEASGDETRIRVAVRDSGIGIAAQVLPHIFEPFVSTKGDEKGVGLGLAVTYGIIQRHEGSIDVESQPGVGTTFFITLPRKPSQPISTSPAEQ